MKYICLEMGECPFGKDICCFTCDEYEKCEAGKCDLPDSKDFIKCAEAVKE